jgi:hypothetical protein
MMVLALLSPASANILLGEAAVTDIGNALIRATIAALTLLFTICSICFKA